MNTPVTNVAFAFANETLRINTRGTNTTCVIRLGVKSAVIRFAIYIMFKTMISM